jgi:hypothetical protein
MSPERGFKLTGLAVLAAGTIAYLVRAKVVGDWPWRRDRRPA